VHLSLYFSARAIAVNELMAIAAILFVKQFSFLSEALINLAKLGRPDWRPELAE
jgi:hypothetical protein